MIGRKTKTRKAYRIKQRAKYSETKPELIVFGILDTLRVSHTPHHPIVVEGFTFDPDTIVEPFGIALEESKNAGKIIVESKRPTVIEVDGPYHRTRRQQQKTKWRDSLLNKAGYRIIHIPSELTETQKLRDYLKGELKKAIESESLVVNIVA